VTDIFVSYAREDRDTVSTLAAHLEATGWTVWWDRQILAGKEFDTVIETEIGQARCVLVVWSAHSVDSRWVKTEASEGLRRDILVPIIVDGCTPPLAFRNIQSVSFPHAVIEPGSAAFDDLIASITPLVKPRAVREPAVAVATEPSHAAAAVLVHESHAIGQAPVYTAPAESTRGDASRRPWYRRWPVVVGVALAVILFGTVTRREAGARISIGASSTVTRFEVIEAG